uniref:Unkown protein n=1 Tax=Riptortus pedestris TaxID=329032 RepID=R4WDB7_RIPPE|nr:unkown protein [Riptortus pedestris]
MQQLQLPQPLAIQQSQGSLLRVQLRVLLCLYLLKEDLPTTNTPPICVTHHRWEEVGQEEQVAHLNKLSTSKDRNPLPLACSLQPILKSRNKCLEKGSSHLLEACILTSLAKLLECCLKLIILNYSTCWNIMSPSRPRLKKLWQSSKPTKQNRRLLPSKRIRVRIAVRLR